MAEKEKEFEICKLAKRLTMIYIVQAKKEKKFSCFNDSDRKDFSRYLEIRFQLFINEETEPKDKTIRKEWYDLAVAMNPYFSKRLYKYVCAISETLPKIPKIENDDDVKNIIKEFKKKHKEQKKNEASKKDDKKSGAEIVKKSSSSSDDEKECGIIGDAICGTATAIADFFCWL